MSTRRASATRRHIVGGFVDDACPALGDLLAPAGVDAASFEHWLGPLLGNYRMQRADGASMPTREVELYLVEQLEAVLAEAGRQLGGAPGPRGEAAVSHVALQLGFDWPTLTKRLQQDLAQARGLLGVAATRVSSWPVKRGRKRELARAELLRAVIERLREAPMGAQEAQRLAELVLIRCRVPVPASNRAVRRAAKVPTGQK